jgi:hypothetical protein
MLRGMRGARLPVAALAAAAVLGAVALAIGLRSHGYIFDTSIRV